MLGREELSGKTGRGEQAQGNDGGFGQPPASLSAAHIANHLLLCPITSLSASCSSRSHAPHHIMSPPPIFHS